MEQFGETLLVVLKFTTVLLVLYYSSLAHHFICWRIPTVKFWLTRHTTPASEWPLLKPCMGIIAHPPHVLYFLHDSKVEAVNIFLKTREATPQQLKHLTREKNMLKSSTAKKRTERKFQLVIRITLYFNLIDSVQWTRESGSSESNLGYDRGNAYRLQLPSNARIHGVFQVSLLKPVHASVQDSTSLPPMFQFFDHALQSIIGRRMVKRKKATRLISI